MLNNAAFVIMGASRDHYNYVVRAKQLGLKTIIIDRDTNAFCVKHADVFLELSLIETKLIIDALINLNKFYKIIGILTYCSDPQVQQAYSIICQEFSLRGPRPAAVDKLLDKSIWKKAIAAEGINTPDYISTNSEKRFLHFINNVSKAVVKPAQGSAGSAGVTILDSKSNSMIDAFHNGKINSLNGNIIAEEFIEGNEYTVDCLIADGLIVFINIARKFHESNKILSYQLDYSDPVQTPGSKPYGKLLSQIRKIIKVLELDNSCFGIDLIVHKNKFYFIDMGILLDAKIDRLFFHRDIDIYLLHCQVCCGLSYSKILPLRKKSYSSLKFIYADHSGVFNTDNFVVKTKSNAIVEWDKVEGEPVKKAEAVQDLIGWIIE